MNARELIWGLQHLKKLLPEDTSEKFLTLECELLEILHRQKVTGLSEQLEHKQTALFAQCDQLALTYGLSKFADLCAAEPSISTPIPTTKIQVMPDMHTALPTHVNTIQDFYGMVDIQLLTNYVPIAYCFQKKAQGQEYPLVKVTFHTTKLKLPCLATVTVAFVSYGEPVKKTLLIEPGKQISRVFLPTFTSNDLERLHERCPASLDIKVELLTDQFLTEQRAPLPLRKTIDVHLYPRNVAVLWRRQPDGTLFNCTNGLAAWVTPKLRKIEELHRKAAAYHPAGELWGYFTRGTRREQREEVRAQVRALFQALCKNVKLAYATSSNVVRPEADQIHYILQNVRLPADIFKAGGPANCLDGSLLFASLLEKANLYPSLLLYQGHAVVGWRVAPREQRYEFLETTSIHNGDFELACQQGWAFYRKAYPGGRGTAPTSNTPLGPLLIDIAVCRERDIVPMDW